MQVRLQRTRRRWRQVDLAAAAGVSQSDVSSLERDRSVAPSRVQGILAALDMLKDDDTSRVTACCYGEANGSR
jgi:transcriptional regulator with XRE-family HTH domain